METTIKPYLNGVDMEKVKLWYNGYNFLANKVYNPYGILQFIHNDRVFKNYWFESGTPAFLIKLLKENNYFVPKFESLVADEYLINSFDIEDLSLETIMFQAGYLTITEIFQKRNRMMYKLDFPNLEVKNSFFDYLLDSFVDRNKKYSISDDLYDIFENGSIENLEPIIKQLFSSIAYNNFTKKKIKNYEGFYASVLYAYFTSLGLEITAEDVTNYGRIDLTIVVNKRSYLFEFKVIKEDPLKQIKEKKYFEKYSGEVYIIGIVFDPEKRNVTDFKWEKI